MNVTLNHVIDTLVIRLYSFSTSFAVSLLFSLLLSLSSLLLSLSLSLSLFCCLSYPKEKRGVGTRIKNLNFELTSQGAKRERGKIAKEGGRQELANERGSEPKVRAKGRERISFDRKR